jgi:O-antigen/teichoic acid export membrane protein
MNSIKKHIITGSLWILSGQFGTTLVTLIANIFLARMLSPSDFGKIGIVMVFIHIANVFSESGLGGALVRKAQISKQDYSTVFIINICVSVFLYFILCLLSTPISNYYNIRELQNLLIISGLILLTNSISITQSIYLTKNLYFKRRSFFLFISTLISSVIGILLAYYECGVWALVIMYLSGSLINTILLLASNALFFPLKFSKKSFVEIYKFGIYTTASSLLNIFFDNIYQLILGRFFSINQVGLFHQSKKIQYIPVSIVSSVTNSVFYPSLSILQNNTKAFGRTYSEIILYFTSIIGLVMSFIYLYSREIIILILGNQWEYAAIYMKLLSVASFFYLQETLNRIIFKIFDRTNEILIIEIIKKSIQSITIIIGIHMVNIEILLYGFIFTSIISYIISFFRSRKILLSGYSELVVLIKVVIISIIDSTIFCVFMHIFELKNFHKFIVLPFFILFYIISLKCWLNFDLISKSLIFFKKCFVKE